MLRFCSTGTNLNSIGHHPEQIALKQKVEKGDCLCTIENPEGYLLTPYDPAIREELETGQEFMKKYRDTFEA